MRGRRSEVARVCAGNVEAGMVENVESIGAKLQIDFVAVNGKVFARPRFWLKYFGPRRLLRLPMVKPTGPVKEA